MPPFQKMALPLMGTLVLVGVRLALRPAWAQPGQPPVIGEEIQHARNDFASGGVRRLSNNWCGVSQITPYNSVRQSRRESGHQADDDTTEVRLRNHDGTLEVPVTIRGAMTLPFAIDSGASDVTVSSDVMEKLIQAGTVSQADFLGKQTYHLADGSVVASETFRIHLLKVGDREVRDVVGSITNDADSLLLGQSFLKRFRSWLIDNQRQVLLLK